MRNRVIVRSKAPSNIARMSLRELEALAQRRRAQEMDIFLEYMHREDDAAEDIIREAVDEKTTFRAVSSQLRRVG